MDIHSNNGDVMTRMQSVRKSNQESAGRSEGESLLISRAKAAMLLDVSVATLDRMQASGKLPRPLPINGGIRYRREDLVRWIALGCPSRKEFEGVQHA